MNLSILVYARWNLNVKKRFKKIGGINEPPRGGGSGKPKRRQTVGDQKSQPDCREGKISVSVHRTSVILSAAKNLAGTVIPPGFFATLRMTVDSQSVNGWKARYCRPQRHKPTTDLPAFANRQNPLYLETVSQHAHSSSIHQGATSCDFVTLPWRRSSRFFQSARPGPALRSWSDGRPRSTVR